MSSFRSRSTAFLASGLLAVSLLAGCSTVRNIVPGGGDNDNARAERQAPKKVAPNMGVNSYLWRASLETLEFMPLSEVDPFGGVIITDWYANPEEPNERFKANVYILDANCCIWWQNKKIS